MHLAELNIGVFRHPLDDPRMAEFVDNLDRINGLAERSTGSSGGCRTNRAMPPPSAPSTRDGRQLSVWRDAESLERFVWNTVHKRFYRQARRLVRADEKQHFVMWWVAAGHRPTLAEAKERLDHLHRS